MSDPVMVCVAVILKEDDERFEWKKRKEMREQGQNPPSRIGYGYEDNDAWGVGQDTDWQNTTHGDNVPSYSDPAGEEWQLKNRRHIYGYEVASTWNGVIVMNGALQKEIDKKKKELRKWFPHGTGGGATIETIVRGKQN